MWQKNRPDGAEWEQELGKQTHEENLLSLGIRKTTLGSPRWFLMWHDTLKSSTVVPKEFIRSQPPGLLWGFLWPQSTWMTAWGLLVGAVTHTSCAQHFEMPGFFRNSLINYKPYWALCFCGFFWFFFFFFFFLTRTIFIEFFTILILFHVLVFWPQGMWHLSPQTKNPTHTICIGKPSLNLLDCLGRSHVSVFIWTLL